MYDKNAEQDQAVLAETLRAGSETEADGRITEIRRPDDMPADEVLTFQDKHVATVGKTVDVEVVE